MSAPSSKPPKSPGAGSVSTDSPGPSQPRSHSGNLRALHARKEQESLIYASDASDAEIHETDKDGCLRPRLTARPRAARRHSGSTTNLLAGNDEAQDVETGYLSVLTGVNGEIGEESIFAPNPWTALPVYSTIQRVRWLIFASIDDPYTMEQLKKPRMNILIVKPLVEKLYVKDDVSVVYCLLVNRIQFLREQSFEVHQQTVNVTRASLCEIVAAKILRRHDEEARGRNGLLQLANIFVAGFEPFQNAPPEIIQQGKRVLHFVQKRGGYEGKLTALELAILSESKFFLSSAACQKIVDAVYRGRIVYTPTSFIDILPDHYKHKGISLYNPRKAPLLNHYRLNVPRTRKVIEIFQFVLLLVLYILCMTTREQSAFTIYEFVFFIYCSGWVLEEFASILEHGWTVHTQNLWAFLDLTFIAIFWVYCVFRALGWATDDRYQGQQALNVLAVAAPVLLPRLAFCLMPENMLFISLRAMVAHFFVLTLLAVWCFAGFLISMIWLRLNSSSDAAHPIHYTSSESASTVSLFMLWIWFGLDGTGLAASSDFHPLLGPLLMILFAFLGNTLFLTALVSILSNTFSKIAAEATTEINFRRTVVTFEGVKSDAIFAYPPPFNLLALFILLPAKFLLSPRWFHQINVATVRVLNAPVLLIISLYERQHLWKPRHSTPGGYTITKNGTGMSNTSNSSDGFFASIGSIFSTDAFTAHGDLQAVFDIEPPRELVEELEDDTIFEDAVLEHSFTNTHEWRLSSVTDFGPNTAGAGAAAAGAGSLAGGASEARRRRRKLSTFIH